MGQKRIGGGEKMKMNERETTFENAKVGDRVYSPLFKCKNPDDKTNGTINRILNGAFFQIEVLFDRSSSERTCTHFQTDGRFFEDGGQVLFWENPIKEVPIRQKRKVTKKGWIGIRPAISDNNQIAFTSHIFNSELSLDEFKDRYQIKQIDFEAEE